MNRALLARLAPTAILAGVAGGAVRAAPPGSAWGADYFPNVEMTTQDGKKVRFYDDLVKDRYVVVSFIFTRCKEQCPLITATLSRVQRELGDRVGRDIHFVSISLDPEVDTPRVLKRYAEQFRAGPGWTFVTGKEEDVDLLKNRFGDLSKRKENHAGTINIGNDRLGAWMHTNARDNPKYLAMVIGSWLDPTWSERKPEKSYLEAPRRPAPSAGKKAFHAKCAACHNVGQGQDIGPDLAGVVARRGETWLARWLADPEKMIREKDPVARSLVKRHGGLEMPNMRLDEREIAAIIEYLRATEDREAGDRVRPDR